MGSTWGLIFIAAWLFFIDCFKKDDSQENSYRVTYEGHLATPIQESGDRYFGFHHFLFRVEVSESEKIKGRFTRVAYQTTRRGNEKIEFLMEAIEAHNMAHGGLDIESEPFDYKLGLWRFRVLGGKFDVRLSRYKAHDVSKSDLALLTNLTIRKESSARTHTEERAYWKLGDGRFQAEFAFVFRKVAFRPFQTYEISEEDSFADSFYGNTLLALQSVLDMGRTDFAHKEMIGFERIIGDKSRFLAETHMKNMDFGEVWAEYSNSDRAWTSEYLLNIYPKNLYRGFQLTFYEFSRECGEEVKDMNMGRGCPITLALRQAYVPDRDLQKVFETLHGGERKEVAKIFDNGRETRFEFKTSNGLCKKRGGKYSEKHQALYNKPRKFHRIEKRSVLGALMNDTSETLRTGFVLFLVEGM